MFQRLASKFTLVDLDKRDVWPRATDWRAEKADAVLEWANERMGKGTWPWEDYKELLELVILYLGKWNLFLINLQVCFAIWSTTKKYYAMFEIFVSPAGSL